MSFSWKTALSDSRTITWIAVGIVVIGVILRMIYPSTIYFNIHAERDVWRTIEILEGDRFPHVGSELTRGGYTPGPGLYLVQIPPLLFTLDPRGLLVWLALIHGGALWLTFLIGREHFSPRVGLAALSLFATFPLACLALRYLWNPSYVFPLSALFFWSLMDWIFKRTPRRLPWLVFSVALMIQIHLSALTLLLLSVICGVIYRPPLTKKIAAISVGVFLLVFSPYIIGELATNFKNTRLMATNPDSLKTANDAVIPLKERKRVMINVGAMKALQVALSPVFYDRRYETGSFSYLALLAEFGPHHLPQPVWRIAFLLHQARWLYIGIYFLFGLLLLIVLARGRWFGLLEGPEGEEGDASPRRKAIFFILSGIVTITPPLFAATMVAPLEDGEEVGVGAVRYYFIYYPLPFLILALMGRALTRALRQWMPKGALYPAAIIVAGATLLQAVALLAYYHTAHEMRRSFKYSLHEAFDWSVQQEAADVLVNDWGITPEQFRHRFETLDHTFDSTRWDLPSLEMGLDYAYYTHPDLDPNSPPKHEKSYIYLYDKQRLDNPDLSDINVLEKKEVGGLVLLRSDEGEWREHSPIQNTWELMEKPEWMRD